MRGNWKSWLASASVLLLVGAGCAALGEPKQPTNEGSNSGAESEDSKDVSLDAAVDAALDAALVEVDSSTSEELKENADAEIIMNDSAELNAYGQAYDQNEL